MGPVLLWALAVGLFLYAVARRQCVPSGPRRSGELGARIGYLCSAALYGFLGVTAVALARSEQAAADGNQKVRDVAQRFMENSAGRWLVGIVGVILVAVGLYRIKKAVTQDVEDELDLGGVPESQRRWVRRLAAVGEIGRGVAFGLVGFFLARRRSTSTPPRPPASMGRSDVWRTRPGGRSWSPSSGWVSSPTGSSAP